MQGGAREGVMSTTSRTLRRLPKLFGRGHDGKEVGGNNGERIGGEAPAVFAGGIRGGHAQRGAFLLGARARGRESDGAEGPRRRRPSRADEHDRGSPGAGRCGGMVFHKRKVQAHFPGRRQGEEVAEETRTKVTGPFGNAPAGG